MAFRGDKEIFPPTATIWKYIRLLFFQVPPILSIFTVLFHVTHTPMPSWYAASATDNKSLNLLLITLYKYGWHIFNVFI